MKPPYCVCRKTPKAKRKKHKKNKPFLVQFPIIPQRAVRECPVQ